MDIQLSDHFNYKRLLRFTLPSMAMMVFTSIYGVVDGYFVSNYAGKTPFTAINFIMPFLMMLGAIGFMFGTGGSALISKTLGMGDHKKARQLFSMLIFLSLIISVVLAVFGIVFIRPIASWLGAEGAMLDDCVTYASIILIALPALILQFEFQSFFILAEKPQLGLASTVIAGVTNMLLDALLVWFFSFGLIGAAIATAASQIVGGLLPLLYFTFPNSSLLRLCKPSYDIRSLFKVCTNGSSEFVNNISMSIVGMLYNAQLLKYAKEDGVAAYGVLMYVNFVFISIFIGYSVGIAPVIGFHFGAQNHDELKNLRKKSTSIIGVCAISMFVLSLILARPLSEIFVGYDRDLCEMTVGAFRLFSLSFLFAGFSIFGSGFFTALNNGAISAMIAFLRTLVFQIAAVLLLPLIFDVNGIWISVAIAELLAALVTSLCLILNKKRYCY